MARDRELLRQRQREWKARRRAEWFADKSCVDCGATEGLELDHVDPAQKVSHAVWSWAKERREAELAKCVVRCGPCHRERHAAERRGGHGTLGCYRRGCRCAACKAAKREERAHERLLWRLRAGGPVWLPEHRCWAVHAGVASDGHEYLRLASADEIPAPRPVAA